MKEFTNRGCGRCALLAEKRDVILVARLEVEAYPFVVASGPIERDGSWCHGTYCRDIQAAVQEFEERTK